MEIIKYYINQVMMKQKNKKVIFTIQPNHCVDLITNSSSELFVLKGETKEIVKELLESTYSDYLYEYEDVQHIDELSNDDFDTYLSYKYWDWKNKLILSHTFGIKPEVLYSNYDSKDSEKYWYPQLSEEGIKLIKDKMDPNREMYFLFSIHENPNWDRQEDLMGVADRYHLG